ALTETGLTAAFDTAVADVTGSPEYQAAFANATSTDGDTKRMLARALIAHCLSAAAEDGVDVSGSHRDELVQLAVEAFGVPDQGILDALKRRSQELAWWGAHPVVRNMRPVAIKMLADVVLYQAHGDEIRALVADKIRDLRDGGDPVVVLAHSLGGIIAF